MMQTRRSVILKLSMAFLAVFALVLPVLAEELIGTIKSVDADANKFVVTSSANNKDFEVKVDGATVYEREKARGKALKKFSLDRLNTGGTVEVTHDGGLASKVVLGKGAVKAAKKKDAN
jgi:hypothetical protein